MVFPFGFISMPGPMELIVIALIVLLLFGNRLPGAMRSMGQGIVEFKKGIKGIEDNVDGADADKAARRKNGQSGDK